MNHRRMPLLLQVERKVREADDLAGVPEAWEEVGKYWGDIRPSSGREYEDDATMVAAVTHTITTRYCKTATPRMRIKHGDATYEVESVFNVDLRNRWTTWQVREVV